MKVVLSANDIQLTIKRLCYQIIENTNAQDEIIIIGMQPRGVYFSDRLVDSLTELTGTKMIHYGKLDITFYRDDIRKSLHLPNQTDITFSIENKRVVILDDVLYTGRTIRAAMDALVDFGRPSKVELCVLIDRRLSREFPIQPDYCGKAIDTFSAEKVKVLWEELDGEDKIIIH
ncbi:MAG: bifunctional pyr operon transcriptional regulator/uracil phosphoribosyltransferase PyrR [Chitinophagaceae bacterium]